MPNITLKDEDYKSVVALAGKMQQALGKKVSLGTAAGSASRYVVSETKRLEEIVEETEHAH